MAEPKVVFGTHEKWRINRNIFVLGFAFMIHFTAFHGTANLQSSLNSDAGAGTFTLAAIYFSLIISNILLPAVVIKWLGCKWAVAVSFVAYMPFIIAQFYPRLYSLVPAGMMVGFGGGPLWCAKCTYLSVLSGVPAEVLVVRFFGLFFMFYQMAQIWGNLVSSAMVPLITNATAVPTIDFGATCGENGNLEPPSQLKIQVIAGIFLAYTSGRKTSNEGKSGLRLLAVTLRQLRHKYQLLLLPVIGNIGFVMICFGVFNALAAPIAGAIVKLTGRFPVMVTALWLVLYLLAAIWGTADAVWLVQVNALSGILFPGDEEAAYSNFRLWEATGS
ncbi:putative UNC93A protein, partial [Operophtera brumata]